MSDDGRVAFFYCNGTASFGPFGMLNLIGELFQNITTLIGISQPNIVTVAGLHGRTAPWPDVAPQNDPFCNLLDPNIFDARKVAYPAAMLPLSLSMDVGITNTIAAINALPAGKPFAIGGFSQGAAVMSGVYNEIRSGSLTSRANSFLGGTVFGNPRRQINYRGSVGGTWSGTLANPGSTTGGHGVFPLTGNYARLTGCEPSRWIDFVHPWDVVAAIGDTNLEQLWTQLAGVATALAKNDILGFIAANWSDLDDVGGLIGQFSGEETFTDAAGKQFRQGGGGHVKYPFYPPYGDPDNGLTSYQIAIKFLETKASEWATAPIVLPDTPISAANAGWSSTLIPPAA